LVHSDTGEPKVLCVLCHCYAVINFIFEIVHIIFFFTLVSEFINMAIKIEFPLSFSP